MSWSWEVSVWKDDELVDTWYLHDVTSPDDAMRTIEDAGYEMLPGRSPTPMRDWGGARVMAAWVQARAA